MGNKIVIWIAIGLSIIALGVAAYFLVSSQAATKATLPCSIEEDPNCDPNPQQQLLIASGDCHLVDGTIIGGSSVSECQDRPNWLKWVSPNGKTVIDNPNPASPPEDPGETDPQELGACFINFKELPLPLPENPTYQFYIDTFANCLQDPDAYAFCEDENATSPENCEYISSLPGGEGALPF